MILALILLNARLIFKIENIEDSGFIPLPKSKPIGETIGEDASITTPYGIALTDGIGGCEFSSAFIARWVASALGSNYMTQFHKSVSHFTNIRDMTMGLVQGEIAKMNQHVETSFGKCNPVLSGKAAEQLKASDIISSTTLISAGIVSHDNMKHATLKLYQKGDSLAIVFRPQEFLSFEGKEQIYYRPIMATEDQQIKFNQPYQFLNIQKEHGLIENETIDVQVFEDDIVILGSDGLFDNIPLSLLTVVVNVLAFEIAAGRASLKDFNTILNEYFTEYISKVTDEGQTIVNYFKSGVWKEDLDTEEFNETTMRSQSHKPKLRQEALRESSVARRDALNGSSLLTTQTRTPINQPSPNNSLKKSSPKVEKSIKNYSWNDLTKSIKMEHEDLDVNEDEDKPLRVHIDLTSYMNDMNKLKKQASIDRDTSPNVNRQKRTERTAISQNYVQNSQQPQTRADQHDSKNHWTQYGSDSSIGQKSSLSSTMQRTNMQMADVQKPRMMPRTFELYQSKADLFDYEKSLAQEQHSSSNGLEDVRKKTMGTQPSREDSQIFKTKLDNGGEEIVSTYNDYYNGKSSQNPPKTNGDQYVLRGKQEKKSETPDKLFKKGLNRVGSSPFKNPNSLQEKPKPNQNALKYDDSRDSILDSGFTDKIRNDRYIQSVNKGRPTSGTPNKSKISLVSKSNVKNLMEEFKSPLELKLSKQKNDLLVNKKIDDTGTSSTDSYNQDYYRISKSPITNNTPNKKTFLANEASYNIPKKHLTQSILGLFAGYHNPISSVTGYSLFQRILANSPEKSKASSLSKKIATPQFPHYSRMLNNQNTNQRNDSNAGRSQGQNRASRDISHDKSYGLSYHTPKEFISEDSNEDLDDPVEKINDSKRISAGNFFKKCTGINFLWEPTRLIGTTKLLHHCITKAIKENLALPEKSLEKIRGKFDASNFSMAISDLTKKIANRKGQFYPSPFWIRARKSNPPLEEVSPLAKDDDITTAVGLIINSQVDKKTADEFDRRIGEYQLKLKADLQKAVCHYKKHLFDEFISKNPNYSALKHLNV